jgi:hypothetical protein
MSDSLGAAKCLLIKSLPQQRPGGQRGEPTKDSSELSQKICDGIAIFPLFSGVSR